MSIKIFFDENDDTVHTAELKNDDKTLYEVLFNKNDNYF
jgi:hypothetical protein